MKFPSELESVIRVAFAGTEIEVDKNLKSHIIQFFPDLAYQGSARSSSAAQQMVHKVTPDIIFFDLKLWKEFKCTTNQHLCMPEFEAIVLFDSEVDFMEIIQNSVTAYLIKPIESESLSLIIQQALQKVRERRELQQSRRFIKRIIQKRLQEVPIGIPTIEGYEFIEVKEIFGCEALRKHTRIFTYEDTDIISAYNLGAFKSLLEPYGFFSPHRSYLVNLKHIKKYLREGTIILADGTSIPVAKRLKKEFLGLIDNL